MTAHRFTLRDLPLPAKLVISGFLLAVGLGYFSALVQLHMQHSSRNGEPLPSPADVVEIFAGVKKGDGTPPAPPVAKLEKLVTGPLEGAPWNGTGSMAAAFFHKDGADYKRRLKEEPDAKTKLDQEREGERKAVVAWVRLADAERKKAYAADALAWEGPLTADFLGDDKKTAKVKTILDERCARCHGPNGQQGDFPLEKYEQFAKYLELPPPAPPSADGWVRSDRQVSIEKLTQSTHAHLLSFAMLFSLTGLTFAFTTYRSWVRCLVSPMVLAAQVADVSCWWLARIDGVGPYFAMAIVGTGTVVGLGLLVQLFGGLWSMYGPGGRKVVAGVLLGFLMGFGYLGLRVVEPALRSEREVPASKS